jgi:dCTP deaminase
MILTGTAIEKEVEKDRITISPFDRAHVTTNSYDLSLGPTFIRYTASVLDPAQVNEHEVIDTGGRPIHLDAGDFLLGHSMETIGSNHFVPIIHARSGIARLGLFVHVTADLIDIGSIGNVTFQLLSTLPITLTPGMRIGQVSFWKPIGEICLYAGKYQGSRGPRPSEVYRDFIQGSTTRNPDGGVLSTALPEVGTGNHARG